jgi:hypothetical protein
MVAFIDLCFTCATKVFDLPFYYVSSIAGECERCKFYGRVCTYEVDKLDKKVRDALTLQDNG